MHSKLTQRDDRGMAAVFVVLMMPLVLVLAAIVFDGARQRPYKREAQGRADAAAVAAALGCSKNACAPGPAAASYVGAGVTVQSATCTSPTCTVVMQEPVTYHFATGGKTVTAAATAKWGALGSATGKFPITLSTCAFTITFNVKVTLHSHNTAECSNPAGQFGFINGGCTSQTVVAGQFLPGTTGNNLNGTGCNEASLNALLNTDVLVPVWDSATGQGASARYHILAYAVFTLTGWSTNGNSFGAPPSTLGKQCDASADGGLNENDNTPCIRGIFKGFSTEVGSIVPGLPCNNNLLACQVILDH